MRGTGPAALIVVTNAARAREAGRFRDALGVQVAAHAEDAGAVEGGADVVLRDDELVRPDARAIRVRGAPPGASGAPPGALTAGQGATVLLLRKAGGVLVVGDLDLTSPAAKQLIAVPPGGTLVPPGGTPLEFSAVLASQRPPTWNAGKDGLLALQRELPKPRKQFSILLDAPWDRAYQGRLEDKMYPNEAIVPREVTVGREAGMGPETLVVSEVTRERMERAKRPVRDGEAT